MHANPDTLSFEMPKCETPKQNSEGYMVEESLRKLHGGGIMELESRGRNHGGGKIVTCVCVGVEGIMEETVERMSHGGGTFEMQSWRRNRGRGAAEEGKNREGKLAEESLRKHVGEFVE